MKIATSLLLFALLPAFALEIKLPPNFDKLAAKATDTVDVTLDGSTLKTAGNFLSADKKDEAQVKKMVSGLKSITIKSFEFAKPGEYSEEDVEALRSLFRAPEWSRIINVQSKKDGENTQIYLRKEGDKTVGIAIINAEPKEFTFVNIDGTVDLSELSQLGGLVNMPKPAEQGAKKAPATKKR